MLVVRLGAFDVFQEVKYVLATINGETGSSILDHNVWSHDWEIENITPFSPFFKILGRH